jgi:hypothetical protein
MTVAHDLFQGNAVAGAAPGGDEDLGIGGADIF